MKVHDEYQSIISKCKFISKKDEWYVEGTESICSDAGSYVEYKNGDKFNDGWSLFEGLTNEGYSGCTPEELPRHDGETCQFSEFFIYDEFGNEISELTLKEYKKILRKEKLNQINDVR